MGTGEIAGGGGGGGVTLRWTSFMLRKPEISAGLMGLPRLVTEILPLLCLTGRNRALNRQGTTLCRDVLRLRSACVNVLALRYAPH